jgi:predicted PurR-regulated permease PerM
MGVHNPFYMEFPERTTLKVAATVLALAGILAFVWLARKPLIAFLFAMLFAYLLEPLIAYVQQLTKRGRGTAISVVYGVLLFAVILFGALIGPKIVSEGRKLASSAPALYQRVATGNIAWQVGQSRGWSLETTQRVQNFLASNREQFTTFITAQEFRIARIASNTLWIALVPILAIFFLKDKSRFSSGLQEMLDSRRDRLLLRGILADIDEMLAHFVRAQLYLALISGTIYTVALSTMRVPYSFVLGTVGGLLEFIPMVGPLIAAVLILGVSFTMNYQHMLLVLGFRGVWRMVQDYVISPRVLGGRVELHPLAAIFGVLVGGEIAGVIGVYLAIPIMAAARIFWRRWHIYQTGQTVDVLERKPAA